MRVNIYEEELTEDLQCFSKRAGTGTTYYGIHFYLKSPSQLHHTATDDDRSAVIFWNKDKEGLVKLLQKAIDAITKQT